jgi:hypothetical protein
MNVYAPEERDWVCETWITPSCPSLYSSLYLSLLQCFTLQRKSLWAILPVLVKRANRQQGKKYYTNVTLNK